MDDVARTLETYEADAESFAERYRRGSIAAVAGEEFRESLPGDRILDVGCGPGADVETFVDEGYDAIGLDPTPSFLRVARDHVPDGSFVRGDMRHLPFDDGAFDGVWSCASLLHVPRPDVPETLWEFRRVLRTDGVVFLSLKSADGDHDTTGDRHFELYLPGEIRSMLADAGLATLDVSSPEGEWIQALAMHD